MVNIVHIRPAVASEFVKRPLVAVFVGGTQGIGDYTVQSLARLYSGQGALLRAYIIGRSQAKAKQVIEQCTRFCKDGTFKFVEAKDIALITDVDRVSNEILKIEQQEYADDNPRIDILVLTQGQVLFGPRQDTAEGLDRSMSLLYYSRVRFVLKLTPLLQASPHAHVVSVYAAGLEANLFRDDWSLRNHYTFANCRSHVVHMKTVAFEHLSKEYPTISFAHIYPGLVVGPGFEDPSLPWWFKVLWRILGPLADLLIGTSKDEAGHRMLFAATDAFPARAISAKKQEEGLLLPKGTDDVAGSGAYALDPKNDICQRKSVYEQLRTTNEVWTHTNKAFEEINAGRTFVN